jgi:hypothetical protein
VAGKGWDSLPTNARLISIQIDGTAKQSKEKKNIGMNKPKKKIILKSKKYIFKVKSCCKANGEFFFFDLLLFVSPVKNIAILPTKLM